MVWCKQRRPTWWREGQQEIVGVSPTACYLLAASIAVTFLPYSSSTSWHGTDCWHWQYVARLVYTVERGGGEERECMPPACLCAAAGCMARARQLANVVHSWAAPAARSLCAGLLVHACTSCAHSSGVVMCLDLRFNLPAGFTICSEIQIDIDQGVMLGYCLCSYVIDR